MTKNMIVVATSADNVPSKWVEYEWRLFLGEVLAERKDGNLITVMAENMTLSELPISLRNREVIQFPDIENLVNYISATAH